jgi:hypothetical protein
VKPAPGFDAAAQLGLNDVRVFGEDFAAEPLDKPSLAALGVGGRVFAAPARQRGDPRALGPLRRGE